MHLLAVLKEHINAVLFKLKESETTINGKNSDYTGKKIFNKNRKNRVELS